MEERSTVTTTESKTAVGSVLLTRRPKRVRASATVSQDQTSPVGSLPLAENALHSPTNHLIVTNLLNLIIHSLSKFRLIHSLTQRNMYMEHGILFACTSCIMFTFVTS